MLNEAQIGEVWVLFQDYIDVKQRDIVAERYVELLADYGVRERILENATGVDAVLDQAIAYYLGETEDDDDEYTELEF